MRALRTGVRKSHSSISFQSHSPSSQLTFANMLQIGDLRACTHSRAPILHILCMASSGTPDTGRRRPRRPGPGCSAPIEIARAHSKWALLPLLYHLLFDKKKKRVKHVADIKLHRTVQLLDIQYIQARRPARPPAAADHTKHLNRTPHPNAEYLISVRHMRLMKIQPFHRVRWQFIRARGQLTWDSHGGCSLWPTDTHARPTEPTGHLETGAAICLHTKSGRFASKAEP